MRLFVIRLTVWLGMIGLVSPMGLHAQQPDSSAVSPADSTAPARLNLAETDTTKGKKREKSVVERADEPAVTNRDSLRDARRTEFRQTRDPKKALHRSLILPGWGQAYNHRWWKLPIVYGGFATFGYFIYDQNKQFQLYKQAVKCKSYATCTDLFPDDDLATLIGNREFYRKYRDMNIIFSGLWYTLTALDAYIDAHMMGFDVSDDLSFHFKPTMFADPNGGLTLGPTLSFNLRIR